jgi:hypothetical protein
MFARASDFYPSLIYAGKARGRRYDTHHNAISNGILLNDIQHNDTQRNI